MIKPAALAVTGRLVRAPIWAGIAVILALSWFYLAHINAGMSVAGAMQHRAMVTKPGLHELLLDFMMWSIMMIAMMMPPAVPALSVFLALQSRRCPQQPSARNGAMYLVGYLTTWLGFSVVAAVVQWTLMRAALLTPMLQSANVALSAAILLAAGVFQFTALKNNCLAKCRMPLAFFLAEWRDGLGGAFMIGLRHGRFCIGCCWALMAVMFVVGAMSLFWMAALTLFVLAEKVAPAGWHIARWAGLVFVVWGGLIASSIIF